MKLRQPTDFLILEALLAYGRNVAPNIAEHSGKSRKNVNNRLPVLEDYGLVTKIGPAKRAGLYEITEKGQKALKNREEYSRNIDFEALINDEEITAPPEGTPRAVARGNTDSEDNN